MLDVITARPFIQALAQRNVITGFADGTFRPDEPVDRAEFAAMIQKKAFNQFGISAGAQMFLLITRLLQLRKPTKPDLWEAILVLCFARSGNS